MQLREKTFYIQYSALHSLCIMVWAWNEESITKSNIISAFLSLCCHYLPPHYPSRPFHPYHLCFASISTLSAFPQTLLSSFLSVCILQAIILNLHTCLPQVFRSACYGFDRQLWDSALGPGEDRQWHSARHPPLCSHRFPCSYHTHTHALADPCTF